MTKKNSLPVRLVVLLAVSIALNIVGSNIALMLRLPVYLDSIGTIFAAAVFGPWAGIGVGTLTDLIMGLTTDITSLYYIPVAIVLGGLAGLVYRKYQPTNWKMIWYVALIITLPATIVSTIITYFVFGSVTSSGSSLIVQFIYGLGVGKFMATFIVQIITDYLDRLISVYFVASLFKVYPSRLK